MFGGCLGDLLVARRHICFRLEGQLGSSKADLEKPRFIFAVRFVLVDRPEPIHGGMHRHGT